MSHKGYLPAKDTELQAWTQNFLTAANANLVSLGMVAGDVTSVSTDKTSFDIAVVDNNAKQAAAKAAVQKKNTVKSNLGAKIRVLVRKIQAKPTVMKLQKVIK